MITRANGRSPVVRRWVFLIPLTIIVFDQLLKAIMTAWLGPDATLHRYDVVGSFAGFQYLENSGAAFGILPEQTALLTVTSLGITAFALVVMWRESRVNLVATVAIGMIAGGALGNIIDRIRLGYVVDFISVGAWPTFNLADSMVTVGVVTLLWSTFQNERERSSERANEGIDG